VTGAIAGNTYLQSAGPAVSITDQYISKAGHGSATASYVIASDGKVKNQAGTILESWLLSGSASSFEVRATVTSGTLTSGTTGSWLACSSDRTWSITNSAANNSTVSVVMTVEIRNASTLVVADSATITLEATSLDFTPPGGGGGLGGP
jgi:hypothetical protein